MKDKCDWLRIAEEIKSISQNGLAYCKNPSQIPHAYKAVFICTITEGISKTNHETSDIGWYKIDALPDLSLHRVMPNQIVRLYEHSAKPDIPTDFD